MQDPNTLHVPYELFIKLPPWVKTLICEAQKAESGNQPCKVNIRDVSGIASADLAPDIMPVEQSFYETEGTEDAALEENVEDDQQLLAHLTHHKELPPNDIWCVLASQQSRQEQQVMQHSAINKPKKSITIDGIVYTANVHNIEYLISKHHADKQETSLVDHGANGGMAGDDVMVVERGECFATVNVIDGHTIQDLPICAVAALVQSNKGPIIVIMHQYAYLGKGKTIHSSAQIEYYKNSVDDKSSKVGDKQHIVTLDGYIISLNICNGLAYTDMSVPMNKEFSTLPHVVLTSNVNWDPSILDSEFNPKVEFRMSRKMLVCIISACPTLIFMIQRFP